MITAEYIREQLASVQKGEPSPAKVRDYALLCIALEHISGKDAPALAAPIAASTVSKSETVRTDGDSDFLRAVNGKDAAAVLGVLDKHMGALRQMNERAYNLIMKRIQEI